MTKPYADLIPRPLTAQIDQMLTEYELQKSIFWVREKDWYAPEPEKFDFSVSPFAMSESGRAVTASTPFGPAAGPHTQMSQNLVLAWLCGARIMELKTVQILDELTINRPCMHIPNIGFNIEWSQELHVHESLHEYVVGAMLIRILQELGPEWGHPEWPGERTIYDMSIGYDLEGIQTEKVTGFIRQMKDAKPLFDDMRRALDAPHFARFRDLDFPDELSNSITLSTFHGCPPDEIEKICNYLLDEMGVHVCVKMNPTMLGLDEVNHLLHDVMGFEHLEFNDKAFEVGLQYDDSLDIMKRLQDKAAGLGLSCTVKFTNTLELKNNIQYMPDEIMYLSGPPLHVISSTLASKFRDDYFKKWGSDIGISFSAGIEKANFCDAAACGFRPLTSCTDLLKTGGYPRATKYLNELKKDFERTGTANIDDYIRARAVEKDVAGADDSATPVEALMRGFHAAIIPDIQGDERYRIAKNTKEPPKIESELELFDCISCNKCIPVCPNAANFWFPSEPFETETEDFIIENGDLRREPGPPFKIEKKHQIANFFDWCNECGNCDTYCPEHGGPFIEKPTFFGSLDSYLHFSDFPGACAWEDDDGAWRCILRWQGGEYSMRWDVAAGAADVTDGQLQLRFDTSKDIMTEWGKIEDDPPKPGHRFRGEIYFTLKTIINGFRDPASAHLPKALAAK